MENNSRRTLAVVLLLGALVTGALALWQAKRAQSADLVAQLGGFGRGGDRTVMWVLIGATAVLLIGALLSWLSTGRPNATTSGPPILAPGWYDDPENHKRLRYWDGATWTDRVAEKDDQ